MINKYKTNISGLLRLYPTASSPLVIIFIYAYIKTKVISINLIFDIVLLRFGSVAIKLCVVFCYLLIVYITYLILENVLALLGYIHPDDNDSKQ